MSRAHLVALALAALITTFTHAGLASGELGLPVF